MFHYDKERNLLEVYKVPFREPQTVYQPSESYESFHKYVTQTVKEDIRDYVIPMLNSIAGASDTSAARIWLNSVRTKPVNTGYKNQNYWNVMVSLGMQAYPQGTKEFCMFRIPHMDHMGVIHRDSKRYSLHSELTQDNEITYEHKKNKHELKVIMRSNYITLTTKSTKQPKFEFRKKNYDIDLVLIALAKQEGIDLLPFIRSLRVQDIINKYNTEEDVGITAELVAPARLHIGEKTPDNVMAALTGEYYQLGDTREFMNSLLTLDRALDEELAQPVELSNGNKFLRGTVLTANILKQIKKARVSKLYVKDIPTKEGHYLAAPVHLPIIRKGSEILPQIKKYFPDIKGNYVDNDYYYEVPLTLGINTEITPGFLEFLYYNGHSEVELKESESSNKSQVVYLEREILTNRQYRECELNPESNSNDWCYLKEDGTYTREVDNLTAYDLLALTSLMYQLIDGGASEYIVNRDMGFRKKVNMANEVFHREFVRSYKESLRIISNNFRLTFDNSVRDMDNPDKMESMFWILQEKWWKALYKTRLIQPIDSTNPVALYSSLTKIETIVADRNAVADNMRGLSLGHYGRICPYETPQSGKLGVTNNKATGCQIRDGILRTPYNRVMLIGDRYFISDEVIWLTVAEEEDYRIADLTSLEIGENREILTRGRVLARVPAKGLEKMTVEYIDIKYINLVNADTNQTLGFAAETIPFIGADDSTRVSFETSMCKQAKALLNPEVPLVMTAAHVEIPRMYPYYEIHAEYDGIILEANDTFVVVDYGEDNIATYEFLASDFTKDAAVIRSTIVEAGEMVRAGQTLVTSNVVKDGFMAMGTNALVGYIPVGYNYEDGVFASERLKHKCTSYGPHIVEEVLPKNCTSMTFKNINKAKYISKNTKSICQVIKRDDKGSSSTSGFVQKKIKGFMIDAVTVESKFIKGEKSAVLKSISFDFLNGGDKLANRHGNKGVTPKLRPNTDMPMFPNGEFLDLCYNPTGVTSRMNIGQILEANAGLAAYVLGIRIRSDSFNGASDTEIKTLLSYAYHLANDEDERAVVARFSELPYELHEYCLSRIESIRNWKDCFNEKGEARLFNPKTGAEFECPVVVGINYIYKLVHEVAKKVHARGGFITENQYMAKSDAPPKGAAHSGGQRSGYMEVDGYNAYGATGYVHELMNERGDNAVARNNFTVGVAHEGDRYMVDESFGIRRSVQYFVQGMAGCGISVEFDNGELPNDTKLDNESRRYCKRSTIRAAFDTTTQKQSNESFDSFMKNLSKMSGGKG